MNALKNAEAETRFELIAFLHPEKFTDHEILCIFEISVG